MSADDFAPLSAHAQFFCQMMYDVYLRECDAARLRIHLLSNYERKMKMDAEEGIDSLSNNDNARSFEVVKEEDMLMHLIVSMLDPQNRGTISRQNIREAFDRVSMQYEVDEDPVLDLLFARYANLDSHNGVDATKEIDRRVFASAFFQAPPPLLSSVATAPTPLPRIETSLPASFLSPTKRDYRQSKEEFLMKKAFQADRIIRQNNRRLEIERDFALTLEADMKTELNAWKMRKKLQEMSGFSAGALFEELSSLDSRYLGLLALEKVMAVWDEQCNVKKRWKSEMSSPEVSSHFLEVIFARANRASTHLRSSDLESTARKRPSDEAGGIESIDETPAESPHSRWHTLLKQMKMEIRLSPVFKAASPPSKNTSGSGGLPSYHQNFHPNFSPLENPFHRQSLPLLPGEYASKNSVFTFFMFADFIRPLQTPQARFLASSVRKPSSSHTPYTPLLTFVGDMSPMETPSRREQGFFPSTDKVSVSSSSEPPAAQSVVTSFVSLAREREVTIPRSLYESSTSPSMRRPPPSAVGRSALPYSPVPLHIPVKATNKIVPSRLVSPSSSTSSSSSQERDVDAGQKDSPCCPAADAGGYGGVRVALTSYSDIQNLIQRNTERLQRLNSMIAYTVSDDESYASGTHRAKSSERIPQEGEGQPLEEKSDEKTFIQTVSAGLRRAAVLKEGGRSISVSTASTPVVESIAVDLQPVISKKSSFVREVILELHRASLVKKGNEMPTENAAVDSVGPLEEEAILLASESDPSSRPDASPPPPGGARDEERAKADGDDDYVNDGNHYHGHEQAIKHRTYVRQYIEGAKEEDRRWLKDCIAEAELHVSSIFPQQYQGEKAHQTPTRTSACPPTVPTDVNAAFSAATAVIATTEQHFVGSASGTRRRSSQYSFFQAAEDSDPVASPHTGSGPGPSLHLSPASSRQEALEQRTPSVAGFPSPAASTNVSFSGGFYPTSPPAAPARSSRELAQGRPQATSRTIDSKSVLDVRKDCNVRRDLFSPFTSSSSSSAPMPAVQSSPYSSQRLQLDSLLHHKYFSIESPQKAGFQQLRISSVPEPPLAVLSPAFVQSSVATSSASSKPWTPTSPQFGHSSSLVPPSPSFLPHSAYRSPPITPAFRRSFTFSSRPVPTGPLASAVLEIRQGMQHFFKSKDEYHHIMNEYNTLEKLPYPAPLPPIEDTFGLEHVDF